MDRIPSTTVAAPTSSSAVQLRRLCKQILGPNVQDDILSSQFRSSLQILSASATGQLAPNTDEFVIEEKIKKYLVRDGREKDVPTFVDIQQRLQRSNIIKNRLAIMTLLYNLSERTNQGVPKRPPPFPNGVGLEAKGDSNGASSHPSYLAKVVAVPYRSRPTSLVNGSSPVTTPTSGYHPPLPPKPQHFTKSPREGGHVATIDHVPVVDTAERELLRELIYVFQGIEGVILKRNPRATDDVSGFTVHPSYRDKFTPPVIHLALRLAEMGWMFNVINQFCEKKLAEKEIGLISQSFVIALKEELSEYYQLLALLETKFVKDETKNLSLHQLSVFTLEPMFRLKFLSTIVQSCGKMRGGALISSLYGYLHHGDPKMSATVHKLLTTVSKPLYLMILRWVLDGCLEDPYAEFFIRSDNKVVDESRLWPDKYSIRPEMIPKFFGYSWTKKILATGKSINFLHSVCHNSVPIPGKEAIKRSLQNETSPANLFSGSTDNKFHQIIDRCYKETSSLLLDILFTQYKFLDHVTAMRKYLLLGQGDLIRYLLELLDEELSRPAGQIYPHNLSGILETAIRATNAQFEDPDILERLDVRLLDIQPGDIGWDVFSLDYKVQGPIGTVFGKETRTHYLMLFNSLWRAKRMEWILSSVWTCQTGMHKIAKNVPELKPVLHLANLLASEMIHFVHQLAYYTAFEVMECSWDQLVKQLKLAENLDEVIEAHNLFLETLIKRALLDERSRDILTQLRAIYDRIVEFSNIQNKLYALSVAESEARHSLEMEIRAGERRREYGLSEAEEEADLLRRQHFNRVTLPELDAQLRIVCQSYESMVKTFLLQLTCSQDQSLQFLSFRLDFNEHYKKDTRLLSTYSKKLSPIE